MTSEAASGKILAIDLEVKSIAKQLPEGKPKYRKVVFRTPVGNGGDIYLSASAVGAENAPRFSLPAGANQRLDITELSSLYYYGTAGDILSVFAELLE